MMKITHPFNSVVKGECIFCCVVVAGYLSGLDKVWHNREAGKRGQPPA
ncbi:hypothetical protein NFK58_16445 [Citrobacter portucalensis]|nr:hypothetical protein [Citrobacter portucalensis]WFZ27012.1 hypothetical protein NFK58_16445 [Citrobacter portucalensis]